MATIYGDRWAIESSLGEGGQAHTFIVRDTKGENGTRYVLKRLKNLKRIERFKQEIEAVRNLNHTNIVRLIDFDLEATKPYLVTEYCSGGSLETATPFWNTSPILALELFKQICEGVRFAHLKGIVHRDIKPSNIFLRDERDSAVVGDFGICYIDREDGRITLTEEVVGPFKFMAPELEDGRLSDISTKSDVYSLGKVLYWLLSGGRIFSREKFRDPEFDLKGRNIIGWNDVYMEHINRLLDKMVQTNPDDRRELENIIILTERTIRLVRKEYNPIGKGFPQPCTYCGHGEYQEQPNSLTAVRNFGITPVGAPDWRILVCNSCGHVQLFRIENASNKNWWS